MAENLVLPYESLNQILTQVRGIGPLISGFEFAPPDGMRSLHLGSIILPLEIIEEIAQVIESSPILTTAAGGPSVPIELRMEMALQMVMQNLWRELDRHARGVRYTLGKRRRTLSVNGRHLLDIARSMNGRRNGGVLLPQVADIDKAIRRVRTLKTEEPPVLLGADGKPVPKALIAGGVA